VNDFQRKSLNTVCLLAAIALTVFSGALHGRMSQRWGAGERMEQAIEKIQRVPADFGNWQQEETLELSKTTLELLSCRGYLHRSYRHRLTGEVVKVAVMVGPGAKMSIHVPEICYEASNFTLLGDRRLVTLADTKVASGSSARDGQGAAREATAPSTEPSSDAFWGVSFQLNDVSQQRLEVAYGWSLGESWSAPTLPRWTVGAAPVLYKLQASHVQDPSLSDAAGSAEHEASVLREFLREFVPVLRESLVSEEEQEGGKPTAANSSTGRETMS